MAGYFNMSLQQQLDPRTGLPAVGAKLTFYEGGTSTPLTVYRDYTVGVPHPSPITLDGYGRVPQVFLAGDGTFYRARLLMADGTLAFDVDGIPVIGPTAGGGGGGDPVTPVDSRALAQTGDIKARYDTGFHDGWLLCNGRTCGSATSGADYASANYEALFLHLWQKDTNLVVAGGRGASAAADWAANKTIALPDFKGRPVVGLDSMGGTAAGRIPADAVTSTGGGPNVLGASGGVPTVTLTAAQTPAHKHNVAATQAPHTHTVDVDTGTLVQVGTGGSASLITNSNNSTTSSAQPAITVSEDTIGGGQAHTNMPPFALASIYIKT